MFLVEKIKGNSSKHASVMLYKAQKAGKQSMQKDHRNMEEVTEAELYVFLEQTEISFTTSTLKKPGRTDLGMKTLRSNQHAEKLLILKVLLTRN